MLILVITSLGIISLYPLIKEHGKDNHSSPYENYDILKRMNQTSYTLYKDILEKQSSKELSYDEAYVKSHKDLEKYNDLKNNLNNKLEEWNGYFVRSLKNLDYLAYDKDISEGKTNTGNKLSELVNTMDNKELNDTYDFYMVVHCDENGEAEVTNVHGADEYTVRNRFSEFSFKRSFDNNLVEENEVRFNPIKNATFIYAIPKELKYEDNISELVNSSRDKISYSIVGEFILIVECIIGIISLLIPYNLGKQVLGINNLLKIPFEINCFILIFGIHILGVLSIETVTRTLDNKLFLYLIGSTMNSQLDKLIMINHYKKIPFTELENMRNKLFHKLYMDITAKMLTDEGQRQLEGEAMGGTAALLAAMGSGMSNTKQNNQKQPPSKKPTKQPKRRR